jgi:hypothetical protein
MDTKVKPFVFFVPFVPFVFHHQRSVLKMTFGEKLQ